LPVSKAGPQAETHGGILELQSLPGTLETPHVQWLHAAITKKIKNESQPMMLDGVKRFMKLHINSDSSD
jgi:hypothetical protein